MTKCSDCGKENLDGMLFCEDCGAKLSDAAPSDSSSEFEDIMPTSESEPNLKLVVSNTGEEIPLPEKDEVIIGREDPVSAVFPDIDTTPYGGEDEGVSRQHAKIFRQEDEYFVEDLNSVNSTFLNKAKLEPETPLPISEGDELMLGRLRFDVAMN